MLSLQEDLRKLSSTVGLRNFELVEVRNLELGEEHYIAVAELHNLQEVLHIVEEVGPHREVCLRHPNLMSAVAQFQYCCTSPQVPIYKGLWEIQGEENFLKIQP